MGRLFIITFFCLLIANIAKALQMEEKNGAIFVTSATTAEIEEMFREHNFNDYSEPHGKFPRIYMHQLPSDWKQIKENSSKHRTFIRILLPLVLKVNENIMAERAVIEQISDKYNKGIMLSENELALLEEKAQKYDIFTRMQGQARTSILLRSLLKNIDVVPPSVLIASAAAYTDWGTSRLALEANSLYLEEIWYSDEGLEPLDDKNAGYRYKEYSSLEECIAARALKINSNINYEYLREARAHSRSINRPPYGEQLIVHMMHDNNLQNIMGLIDYTMTHYDLAKTDYFPQLVDVREEP